MHYFADLITIDFGGLEAYSRYTSHEIKTVFSSLKDIAAKNGLGELWSETQLIGLDGDTPADFLKATLERIAKGLEKAIVGIDLEFAHLPSVGFVYYWRREPEISTRLSQELEEPTPDPDPRRHRMAMFRHRAAKRKLEEIKPQIAYRQKRYQAIQQMVELSKNEFDLPLRAALDRLTVYHRGICAAYRRRIAYELAFEASLATRSFEPYQGYFEPLLIGSLETLQAHTSIIKYDKYSFSIYFNLLARLIQAITYEAIKGEAHALAAGIVVEGEKKKAYLYDQLMKAAEWRAPRLNEDGRIALRVLFEELQQLEGDYERGIYGGLYYPKWGAGHHRFQELFEGDD